MIAHLIEKANSSHKVKVFSCYQSCSVKFFNGKVETAEITEQECDLFTTYLNNSPDFKIEPMVTSGGIVAKRA